MCWPWAYPERVPHGPHKITEKFKYIRNRFLMDDEGTVLGEIVEVSRNLKEWKPLADVLKPINKGLALGPAITLPWVDK